MSLDHLSDADRIAIQILRKALARAIEDLPQFYYEKHTKSGRSEWQRRAQEAMDVLNG